MSDRNENPKKSVTFADDHDLPLKSVETIENCLDYMCSDEIYEMRRESICYYEEKSTEKDPEYDLLFVGDAVTRAVFSDRLFTEENRMYPVDRECFCEEDVKLWKKLDPFNYRLRPKANPDGVETDEDTEDEIQDAIDRNFSGSSAIVRDFISKPKHKRKSHKMVNQKSVLQCETIDLKESPDEKKNPKLVAVSSKGQMHPVSEMNDGALANNAIQYCSKRLGNECACGIISMENNNEDEIKDAEKGYEQKISNFYRKKKAFNSRNCKDK
ncbi:hypothetical protein ACOME3_007283 [Neoechinorhynchus agilis]